jgi:hypothetical protein
MLIFLDESGDAGFKFNQGSTTHFVIALVIFDKPLDAEETALHIKRLREKLKVGSQYEFKFSQSKDFFRYQFFETVRNDPFRIRAMVVDKKKIYSLTFKDDKDSFYHYFASQVIKYNHGKITGANLYIDGSGSREFKRAFESNLRAKVKDGTINKCKFVNSKSDNLIQLADMVSGAIYRQYNVTRPDSSYIDYIRHKIEDLWEFQ